VRLQPFIEAETGPYKDKYRFFRGIHLMIYLILTAVFAYTSGTMPYLNHYITAFVSFTFLIFIRRGYRQKSNSYLEIFFIFNLGVTSLFNIMNNPLMTYIITVMSITLSLAVFIGIVIYHIVTLIRHKFGMKCDWFKHRHTMPESLLEPIINDEDNIEGSPAHIVNKRESLIYDISI
jgi:hypothetical protein